MLYNCEKIVFHIYIAYCCSELKVRIPISPIEINVCNKGGIFCCIEKLCWIKSLFLLTFSIYPCFKEQKITLCNLTCQKSYLFKQGNACNVQCSKHYLPGRSLLFPSTRIGIPANCGLSSKLCNSFLLASILSGSAASTM